MVGYRDLTPFLCQEGLGGHWGVTVRSNLPDARRRANLAYQVQGWAVEAAWATGSQAWPLCAAHPLVPGVSAAGQAVWQCPDGEQDTWVIGGLASAA